MGKSKGSYRSASAACASQNKGASLLSCIFISRLFHNGAHQRSMDASKFLLCFLILFNVPSEKGVGVVNNVASGTIISISTAKGSVIMTSTSGIGVPPIPDNNNANPVNSNTRRWKQYETALSNTAFDLSGNAISEGSSSPTPNSMPPLPTTFLPTTMLSSTEESTTKKPSSSNNRVPANRTTYHVSFNNNVLNSARKYIASYEDLQSRFPDGSPFENNTSINMTVPLGDTAFLRCRVRNLGERSISWIRRRDWHILTTGKTAYTNDERFNVLHVDGTEDWTLQIKFVQKRDNGTYECQVSTGTGIISYFVNLFIAVPEAFILGNGEYHVEQGSNINLVCVIEKSPKPPEYIFWYHNERMINYGNSREVVVRTEPGARTHSRLTIRDARISDTGNYTCKTAHAEPASIFVYVSQASGLFSGDKMAAIQRRKTSGTSSISSSADSTSPVASSSATAALTAFTTLPTTAIAAVAASLTISSIQLSSSINSGGGCGAGHRGNMNKNSNFLLSLILHIFKAERDMATAIVQLLLSMLFSPLLDVFFGTGGQITHFILKLSPFSKRAPTPQAQDYYCGYQSYHHDSFHFANNLSSSLRNCEQQQQQTKLLENVQHQEKHQYPWWRWLQEQKHFVITKRPLQQLVVSSSLNKSLPVFLSSAQSSWTLFLSGLSRFLDAKSSSRSSSCNVNTCKRNVRITCTTITSFVREPKATIIPFSPIKPFRFSDHFTPAHIS
ncbi:unnamed protein product [Orchesella dallaii]|uniref:Ig-like domain-containing protein n=1 Tax=Orchesella dallaii TaxID=48710 RepID=A0ABP1QNL1_9HEXA